MPPGSLGQAIRKAVVVKVSHQKTQPRRAVGDLRAKVDDGWKVQ